MTDERTFTATEVQAAIEAVILFERARAEQLLHLAACGVRAAADANKRTLTPYARKRLDAAERRNEASDG
jgi:hypothetical protein